MTPLYRSTIALLGLCLLGFSCKKDIPGGGGKNPGEPQNIREVASLIESAGRLPQAPRAKLELVQAKESARSYAGIRKLDYSDLAQESDKITTEQQYDYIGTSDEFALLDPWATITWPGCLIQGGSLRGNNIPTAIPLYTKRKSGRILLQIVSGADPRLTGENKEGAWAEDVEVMNEGNVLQAQNNLIRRWRESGVPASTSYKLEVVHSLKEIAIAAGLDINKSFLKLNAAFGSQFSEEKRYVLVKLYQRFYTLSYQDPEGFTGVFKDNIQRSDLAPYTGPGNPICYVSSVSYGRIYYLLYESDYAEDQLMASLNATFSSISISASTRRSEIVSKCRVHMIQRGGDAEAGLKDALDPQRVADFIEKGAIPSPQNVGAPIAFTIKHLYDASPVQMTTTTNFSYRKTQFVPKSKTNAVTVLLRNITITPTVNRKWTVSNLAYVKLKKAIAVFSGKIKPKSRPAEEYKILAPDELIDKAFALRGPIFINTYQGGAVRCGFDEEDRYDRVVLRVLLEVRPETFHNGVIWGIFGDRKGEGPTNIEFVQEFEYEKGGWHALPPTRYFTSDDFNTLHTNMDIEKIGFDIDVNYSFYVDNIRAVPAKRK